MRDRPNDYVEEETIATARDTNIFRFFL